MDVIVQSVTRTKEGKCGLALSQSKNWPTINWGPTKQAHIKQSLAKLILMMTMMIADADGKDEDGEDVDGDAGGKAVVKGRMNSRWLMAGTSCGNSCDICVDDCDDCGHVYEGDDDDSGHNSCVLLAEFYILQGRPMHHPWNVFVLNFKHGF